MGYSLCLQNGWCSNKFTTAVWPHYSLRPTTQVKRSLEGFLGMTNHPYKSPKKLHNTIPSNLPHKYNRSKEKDFEHVSIVYIFHVHGTSIRHFASTIFLLTLITDRSNRLQLCQSHSLTGQFSCSLTTPSSKKTYMRSDCSSPQTSF